MSIQKKIKKKRYNIDCLLDGGSGAGVTINPVSFLVIQPTGVKLIPVNHVSSIDKLLDYIPELMDKANCMIDKCLKDKKEEVKGKKKNETKIEKIREKDGSEEKIKVSKEKITAEKPEDTMYEFEYDEELEDE